MRKINIKEMRKARGGMQQRSFAGFQPELPQLWCNLCGYKEALSTQGHQLYMKWHFADSLAEAQSMQLQRFSLLVSQKLNQLEAMKAEVQIKCLHDYQCCAFIWESPVLYAYVCDVLDNLLNGFTELCSSTSSRKAPAPASIFQQRQVGKKL